MALTPGIGDIDVMVASEFLEAGRAISAGFVTPDRTMLIATYAGFVLVGDRGLHHFSRALGTRGKLHTSCRMHH